MPSCRLSRTSVNGSKKFSHFSFGFQILCSFSKKMKKKRTHFFFIFVFGLSLKRSIYINLSPKCVFASLT